MARRYFLSPIVGVGVDELINPSTPTTTGPYRALASDFNMGHSAMIPTDPTTGRPVVGWALALVIGTDFAVIDADTRLASFEGISLSTRIDSLSNPQRRRIENVLTKFGLPSSLVTQSATLEALLLAIVAQLPRANQYSSLVR